MQSHSRNIDHIPALDHLRLLAALLVFCFHLFHQYFGHWKPAPYAPAMGLVVEGHTGVALFFVLSGFLFMQIAQQGGSIAYGSFIRNRFLRIFPLFVFFFFIATSVGRDQFKATDVLHLFFSNLGAAPTSNSFITGPAWTISLEFTFYLVFPFLARFTLAEGPAYLFRLIALMALVKLAVYGVSAAPTQMFYSTLAGRFDQFLWGMLTAMLWHRQQTLFERHGRWLLVLALVLVWLACAVLATRASYFNSSAHQPLWLIWGTVEALAWALVILAYLGARLPWPRWFARALGAGGRWSYSFYLWHCLVIYVIQRHVGVWQPTGSVALNALANAAFILPCVFLVAGLSYATIERPFLGLRGAYLKR